ncbi:sperm acrosome membrane-associated protein 1 isoform X1 [Ascaphus truei]|uniref:sperm acrosome membrane-associated protein 1 isoform X1 n=1 Tax=Ascaphus truei TaxID=8439 RepID=UPI003F597A89
MAQSRFSVLGGLGLILCLCITCHVPFCAAELEFGGEANNVSATNLVNLTAEGKENNTTNKTEYGPCTTTCGIGFREILLVNGCPGIETKCVLRVEECRGVENCDWGKPESETDTTVRMPCNYVVPENRFTYTWMIISEDKEPILLSNDSHILEVNRDSSTKIYQCETFENNKLIAKIKYAVYSSAGLESRKVKKTSGFPVLLFALAGALVFLFAVIVPILVVKYWKPIKSIFRKIRAEHAGVGDAAATTADPEGAAPGKAAKLAVKKAKKASPAAAAAEEEAPAPAEEAPAPAEEAAEEATPEAEEAAEEETTAAAEEEETPAEEMFM